MTSKQAVLSTCLHFLVFSQFLTAEAAVQFPQEFAPQEGVVKAPEQPYRQELCLNGQWQFQPVAVPSDFKPRMGRPPELPAPTAAQWEKTPIRIPSPWNANSANAGKGGDYRCFPSYPEAWEKVQMGWLRRGFRVPDAWKGKRLILHFEAVAGDAQVRVNGRKVGEHFDIFLPFDVDVTEAVRWDADNELLVGVRKANLFDEQSPMGTRPYPYGSFWGTHIAGIWQDVSLLALPQVRVEDVFVKPLVNQDSLELDVLLRNDGAETVGVSVGGKVQPWRALAGQAVLEAPVPRWTLDESVLEILATNVQVAAGQTTMVTLRQKVGNRLKFWTPESPSLYGLVLETAQNGQCLDRRYERFGWRQLTFEGSRQLLNGQPLELKGDSWHFLGIPQMTRRYAWSWFKMLKDANGNAIRPHAQVYPRFYLDVADEMGVMVLDEAAIWASDGGLMLDSDALWNRCEAHLKGFVRRDRNHPAVFGWSVANEVIPVLKHVRHSPPEVVEAMCQRYGHWVNVVKGVDPTRPWISADGDGDGDGRLPTLVGHYGDLNSMRDWSRKGKPWGIGEQTMAYYGTPKQVAKINGDRAYESMEGRMEGLAYEAYNLIANGQRKYGASYCSVFNLVWYALQPLEFGLSDTTRPYTLEDGIFFGPCVEGRFGVQPERLGPYCITLNAGYDPDLPLYRTWPMFDAVKAAYAPQGSQPCKWDKMPLEAGSNRYLTGTADMKMPPGTAVNTVVQEAERESIAVATFLGADKGATRKQLQLMGVKLEDPKAGVMPRVLIVDGTQLREKEFEQKHAKAAKADTASTPSPQVIVSQTLAQGGTVLIWNPSVKALDWLNTLLPARLELTDREAASLLVKQADPLVASLTAADLYFAELNPNLIMQVGLAGPLVDKGRILLEACNTDWRAWNKQGENVKTAMILRSEREAKAKGAALVTLSVGKGRLVVSSMIGLADSKERLALGHRLLANMGLQLSEPSNQIVGGLFSGKGFLQQALACGSFPAETLEVGGQADYLKGQATIKPRVGDKSGGRDWRKVEVQDGQLFDFKKMNLPGPQEKAVAYLSFWLHSPRPLDDLLIEPDIPKVDMLLGSDDGMQVWLNGKRLLEDLSVHPAVIGQKQCSALPLKRGWNHVLVKVIQGGGNWQFGAQLQCDKPGFLAELRSALEAPAE